MNGEIVTDYCPKCASYTEKIVNIDENTLTCKTCNSQEDYLMNEKRIERELLEAI